MPNDTKQTPQALAVANYNGVAVVYIEAPHSGDTFVGPRAIID